MKYSVYALTKLSKYMGEVEADSQDEAEVKAEKFYDDFPGSVCHQCSSTHGDEDDSEMFVIKEE